MTGISGRLIIPIGKETTLIQITMPGVGEVGEWKDKLRKSKPGWNDVLRKAQKAPGSGVKTL